ncbi:MAG: hypothetical protein QM775_11385 [Pirellulales bacterium]
MSTEPLPAARDELLASLVDELARRAKAGDVPDVEALARQHPEAADELRSLWATIAVAECCFAANPAEVEIPQTLGDTRADEAGDGRRL